MIPYMKPTLPSDGRPEERAIRADADDASRELDRIRTSYLSIRKEEHDRLERIVNAATDR